MEEGESVGEINKINKTVDSIQTRIDEIEQEVEGIEKVGIIIYYCSFT